MQVAAVVFPKSWYQREVEAWKEQHFPTRGEIQSLPNNTILNLNHNDDDDGDSVILSIPGKRFTKVVDKYWNAVSLTFPRPSWQPDEVRARLSGELKGQRLISHDHDDKFFRFKVSDSEPYSEETVTRGRISVIYTTPRTDGTPYRPFRSESSEWLIIR